MKIYTFLLFLSLSSFTSTAQQITVKGNLHTNDSVMVVLADIRKTDSVWTINGQYHFERTFAGTLFHLSVFYPKAKRTIKKDFFPADGEVIFNGDSVAFVNSTLQKAYTRFNRKLELLNRLSANLDSFYLANKPLPKNDRDKLVSISNNKDELLTTLYKRSVNENKNNAVGPYILNRYLNDLKDLNQLDSLIKTIDPQIAAISYPLIQLQKELAAKLSVLPGHELSSLIKKDMSGRAFNSENLKGKYAVLDFWGTWCNPCVSGLPQMKATYQKYKDQINFVSIACHDQEARCRAMIAKAGMNWTQLLDSSNNAIALQFYVEEFPTKMLVGPDGKIIEVFKGEGDAFYKKLDELLSK